MSLNGIETCSQKEFKPNRKWKTRRNKTKKVITKSNYKLI